MRLWVYVCVCEEGVDGSARTLVKRGRGRGQGAVGGGRPPTRRTPQHSTLGTKAG